MKQIIIKPTDKKGEISCKSKMFGLPDVLSADEFEIPTYDCCGDEFDMTFMCQINCEDIAEFDDEELFPKTGLLYFFYNMAQMPSTPNVKDAAAVIYADTEGMHTESLELYDVEGDDISSPEIDIEFTTEPDEDEIGCIFPNEDGNEFDEEFDDEFEEETDEEDESDDVILLKLSSFDTEEISVDFNGGELLFLINRESLKNKDFSDIRVMII